MITRQNLLEVFFDEFAQQVIDDIVNDVSCKHYYNRLDEKNKEEVYNYVKNRVIEEMKRDLHVRLRQHGKYYFRRAIESIGI